MAAVRKAGILGVLDVSLFTSKDFYAMLGLVQMTRGNNLKDKRSHCSVFVSHSCFHVNTSTRWSQTRHSCKDTRTNVWLFTSALARIQSNQLSGDRMSNTMQAKALDR